MKIKENKKLKKWRSRKTKNLKGHVDVSSFKKIFVNIYLRDKIVVLKRA